MSRRQLRTPVGSPAEIAMRRAVRSRDAGLRRINAITRAIVAVVVTLSGALAVLAASGFHGHTLPRRVSQALGAQAAIGTGSPRSRARGGSRASQAPTSPSAHAARAVAASTSPQTAPSQTTTTTTTPAQTTAPAQTPTTAQTTAPAQTTPPAQTATTQAASTPVAPASSAAQSGSSPAVAQPSQAPAPTPVTAVVVSGGS